MGMIVTTEIENVEFPDDFVDVCRESVEKRGLDTQFFVVIQELGEVIDLVSRLGRVGRGGRDDKVEILSKMPSEIAHALVSLGWLMNHYGIPDKIVSYWIEESVSRMRESLKSVIRGPYRKSLSVRARWYISMIGLLNMDRDYLQ